MTVQIIIDGYNFIRQSQDLSLLDTYDLQQGREALINLLADYRRIKPHLITVVFDGADAPTYYQRRDQIKGIEMVFSRAGQTADAVIKKMAAQKREKAVVVSSDMEVVRAAESAGAAVLSSPAFEEKMTRALLMGADEAPVAQESSSGWRPGVRKKGPRYRLSKKERRHRRKTEKL